MLAHLLNRLERVALLCVDLSRDRLDLVHRELAAELLHHFLLFCKPKIHAVKPPKKFFISNWIRPLQPGRPHAQKGAQGPHGLETGHKKAPP